MSGVRLVNLTKRFGNTVAVNNLSLEIQNGEIMTFLGPSGCGKTTTLRCVAGLLTPDEGEIYIGDEPVTDLPPERRKIGLVFQNYALWPHMTVYQNLAFGLELRKTPKAEIRRRIEEQLELVRLTGLEDRYPRQLSGGQQQRVAVARALVLQPQLLLLDEPLSNLDAQLREEMRFELRALQKKLGITSVYVTHDQAEALVLSDRIAVLQDGHLVQVGTPAEIYGHPANRFVAGFIGLTSFVEGVIGDNVEEPGYVSVHTKDGLKFIAPAGDYQAGQTVAIAIRPEHIVLRTEPPSDATSKGNLFEGTVAYSAYLGDMIDFRVKVGNWILRVHADTMTRLEAGDHVFLEISRDQIALIKS